MALEIINYGVEPGDMHDGDTLRAAMIKCVNNFNYLLSLFGDVPTNSDLGIAINNLQIQIEAIEADLSNYAPLNHTHTISQIIGLQNALDSLTPLTTFNEAITNINLLISQLSEQIVNSTRPSIYNMTGNETLSAVHENKIIIVNGVCTLTIPIGLASNYLQSFIYVETGSLTVAISSGVNVIGYYSLTLNQNETSTLTKLSPTTNKYLLR